MKKISRVLLATTMLGSIPVYAEELTIESWRNDDLVIWQQQIIPAFEAKYPKIKVKFTPSAPTEYNAVLNSKLQAGTAGDLITCRPFDASLALYKQGHLAPVQNLDGMENFGNVAKSGWSTDDGSVVYCVPMASVIHGFIYNKDIFEELGLSAPNTVSEFFEVLKSIKKDGTYVPMAMGTNDQWESAAMGYTNIGPNYWKGEQGRLALIAGNQKLTEEEWVAPFRQLAKWGPFLSDGYESQTYPDSQNLFTLGRAAIYPAGSWEISGFNKLVDFKMGAFKPPVPKKGDQCYIADHTDIGLGMNANTKNPQAAKTFLKWVTSKEFAGLYANSLPGFFSLSKHDVKMKDPLAQEFVSWRKDCGLTIRAFHQILSRGTPNIWNEVWNASANVVRGTETPEKAAKRLQSGLSSWYKPQQ